MKGRRFEQFGANQVRGVCRAFSAVRATETSRLTGRCWRACAELGEQSGVIDRGASLTNAGTDAVMRGLLEHIAASNERMEEHVKKPQASPPLVVVPGGDNNAANRH